MCEWILVDGAQGVQHMPNHHQVQVCLDSCEYTLDIRMRMRQVWRTSRWCKNERENNITKSRYGDENVQAKLKKVVSS